MIAMLLVVKSLCRHSKLFLSLSATLQVICYCTSHWSPHLELFPSYFSDWSLRCVLLCHCTTIQHYFCCWSPRSKLLFCWLIFLVCSSTSRCSGNAPALLPKRFFSGRVDLTRESGRNRAYFLDWLLPVPSCFIRTVKGQVNFCGMVEWKYSNWFLSLINDQEERPNTHLKNNDNAIFFFQDACIEMLRSHDCSESQANTTMRSVNFVFYFNA